MTISIPSLTRDKLVTRTVRFRGVKDIMFDRFPGDLVTKLEWAQKIYLEENTNRLILPSINIVSFLSSHNTNSAPKRLRDKRKYKDICNSCLSFVEIESCEGTTSIPFLRNNSPILVGDFGPDKDTKSKIYKHVSVARLEKGIPNPKERPVLPTPWEIEFKLKLLPNKEISEQEVVNLFVEGGYAIGLGTFRGVYGKFEVIKWQ